MVTVDGQPDLHPPTKEELVALAGDNPDGLDEDDLSVPIDKWMDYLVNEYQESRGNAEKFFEALYTEYDTSKDNCLDLTEFTTLVHAVDPTRDDSMVMEMYNMALDCSGDGDNIAPDAFVFVGMQHHLPPSSTRANSPSSSALTRARQRKPPHFSMSVRDHSPSDVSARAV